MRRSSQSGFMLIEVLISVLIFSVGVMALIGLQASMTKAQTEAKVRADASYLASELVGLMWADVANIGSYNDAGCAGYTNCNMWLSKVNQALPNATTAVTVDNTVGAATRGDVSITIRWQLPNGDQHTYLMTTTIRLATT